MWIFARILNSWLTYIHRDLCPPKWICPWIKVGDCRKHSGMDDLPATAAPHLNITSARFHVSFTHAAKCWCLGCVWYFWFIITQTNCYMLVADCCLLALGTAGWENNAVWQDYTVFLPFFIWFCQASVPFSLTASVLISRLSTVWERRETMDKNDSSVIHWLWGNFSLSEAQTQTQTRCVQATWHKKID